MTTKFQELESLTLLFFRALVKSGIKSALGSICPLITERLKKLKNLTLKLSPFDEDFLNGQEEAEMKQEMRRQLCHIPRLYIS